MSLSTADTQTFNMDDTRAHRAMLMARSLSARSGTVTVLALPDHASLPSWRRFLAERMTGNDRRASMGCGRGSYTASDLRK